jgi:hypothetical protein
MLQNPFFVSVRCWGEVEKIVKLDRVCIVQVLEIIYLKNR